MRRFLVLLAFLALFGAACGSDDSDGDAGGAFGADPDSESDGDSDSDSDDGDSESDDGDADDGDSASGTDDGGDLGDEAAGEGADTDFCREFNSVDEEFEEFDVLSASPEELEDLYERAEDAIDDLADMAPSEIEDAFGELQDAVSQLIDVLRENDWDILAVPEDEAQNVDTSGAEDQINAFCGIDEQDPAAGFGDESPDELLEELSEGDLSAGAAALYEALGHDEETAQCLVEELGAFESAEDLGADAFTQEFCGLSIIEIFSGGG